MVSGDRSRECEGEALSQSTALSPYAQIADDDLRYRQQARRLNTSGSEQPTTLRLCYSTDIIIALVLDLVVALGIDKTPFWHKEKSKKGMRKGLAGDDALPSAGPLSVREESYTLSSIEISYMQYGYS